MVLTNPHMKPWIQLIIMKIFMKIVKNLSKVTPVYGSMTHLQVLQISMNFLLEMASDIRRIKV